MPAGIGPAGRHEGTAAATVTFCLSLLLFSSCVTSPSRMALLLSPASRRQTDVAHMLALKRDFFLLHLVGVTQMYHSGDTRKSEVTLGFSYFLSLMTFPMELVFAERHVFQNQTGPLCVCVNVFFFKRASKKTLKYHRYEVMYIFKCSLP